MPGMLTTADARHSDSPSFVSMWIWVTVWNVFLLNVVWLRQRRLAQLAILIEQSICLVANVIAQQLINIILLWPKSAFRCLPGNKDLKTMWICRFWNWLWLIKDNCHLWYNINTKYHPTGLNCSASMFCPSNETLLSITEKTKLLAQKCTQQIRAQSGLSPMRRETATFHLPTPSAVADGGTPKEVNTTTALSEVTSDPAPATGVAAAVGTGVAGSAIGGGGNGSSVSLNCFNTRGANVKERHLVNARKLSTGCCAVTGPKERTTKWYVKVIQMAWYSWFCLVGWFY